MNLRTQNVIVAHRVDKVRDTRDRKEKILRKHKGTYGTRHVRYEARQAREHV